MVNDDAAPEFVAERLQEFYEALSGATTPRRQPRPNPRGADIRLPKERPPPPTPVEVLRICAVGLSGTERTQLVHLIDRLTGAIPRPRVR